MYGKEMPENALPARFMVLLGKSFVKRQSPVALASAQLGGISASSTNTIV